MKNSVQSLIFFVLHWQEGTNILHMFLNLFLSPSPARVHPPGCPGHGHPVPGQVRHGQDRRLRPGHPAADRGGGRAGLGAGHVPHQGAGVPDLKGVREVLKVQPGC